MEEPHTDENRGLSEKKPKRIVKTRQQVEALENFYNEHKYPNEALKLELAESIGLTEKQVSGWFCHRRLKDKKTPNDEIQTHGKQDRSSGVIQDRGSGLRQDSCGSTKQADNNKHFDPKEVESRRFTTENLLPTQIRFDQSQHNNNIMNMNHDDDDDDDDDTSSGSSSPLKDNFHPLNVDHLAISASKYQTHNDVKSVTGRTGPSGYLKVRGQAENAAITAVKRQLGRNYREDGPPLGIEFESLPPGAFESPVNIPVNHNYYDTAVDGSKTFQIPNANNMHERYNPKSYSHPIDLDESGLEIRHASKRSNNNHYTYKQTGPYSKHKHSLSGRHLQMEMDDDSGGENEIKDHFETRIRRPDSVSNRHLINTDENYNYPRGPHKVKYRERAHPFTSDFNVKRGEIVEFQDRGISRKTPQDELLNGERRGIDEYSKLISVKVQQGNDMRIAKRNREDFSHQVYPRKEAAIDVPPRTNMTKRSSLQMTCSFSDDETASSGD